MNILMIGRQRYFIRALEKSNVKINVYLIEEEDVYLKDDKSKYAFASIKGLKLAKYHQSEEYLSVVKEWSAQVKFSGVVAAREAGVLAASRAAELLGLPRLGEKAAQCLTNKLTLRELCLKAGINSPLFKKIESLEELKDFFEDVPVIFKPANRDGSIGVNKISSPNDIEKTFNLTVNATEPLVVDRPIKWEFMVEEFIEGNEVSVECLVKNKEIIFLNVTDYSTKQIRIVPKDLNSLQRAKIIENQTRLAKALEVENGVLHAEWMLQDDKIILVECAGRLPGSLLPDLITNSYQFNFYEAYLNVLTNGHVNLNVNSRYLSAINNFTSSKSGQLLEIKNLEVLNNPKVVEWNIGVSKGDYVKKFVDLTSRFGYFILKTDGYLELNMLLKSISSQVTFVVK
ncbi:MAG: ATP-grasp domain-containing protein [Pseudomonadota bacterium]